MLSYSRNKREDAKLERQTRMRKARQKEKSVTNLTTLILSLSKEYNHKNSLSLCLHSSTCR